LARDGAELAALAREAARQGRMILAEPRRGRGQPAGAGDGEEGAKVVPVEFGHLYANFRTAIPEHSGWRPGPLYAREITLQQEEETMMFEAPLAPFSDELDSDGSSRTANFRTPVDPEAGWAVRNPDRAMLFLFVSPRPCGALEELMAL
jgi:hypothetical protein